MGDVRGEDLLLPPVLAKILTLGIDTVESVPYCQPLYRGAREKVAKKKMQKKIALKMKQLAPWGVAIAILAYLFKLYPPGQVWEAMKYVNLLPFCSFAVAYFLLILVVDTWVTTHVISIFSHKVRFREIFVARCATYPIMVINYPAGQAAFAYYLKRKHDIPIFQVLSVFIFLAVIDLFWIITLAFMGSFFQDVSIRNLDISQTVQFTTLCAYVGLFIWLGFWRRWPERLIGRKLIPIAFVEKLRTRKVFHLFDKARVVDYLRIGLMRTPIHTALMFSIFIVILTFDSYIPFSKILGNVPIVLLIGTLPITPGGLGTANAAMVELLSPYITGHLFVEGKITPAELMFTISLLWMFANYALKIVIGFFFLGRVSKDLFKPTPEVPEELAEHEAAHFGTNI